MILALYNSIRSCLAALLIVLMCQGCAHPVAGRIGKPSQIRTVDPAATQVAALDPVSADDVSVQVSTGDTPTAVRQAGGAGGSPSATTAQVSTRPVVQPEAIRFPAINSVYPRLAPPGVRAEPSRVVAAAKPWGIYANGNLTPPACTPQNPAKAARKIVRRSPHGASKPVQQFRAHGEMALPLASMPARKFYGLPAMAQALTVPQPAPPRLLDSQLISAGYQSDAVSAAGVTPIDYEETGAVFVQVQGRANQTPPRPAPSAEAIPGLELLEQPPNPMPPAPAEVSPDEIPEKGPLRIPLVGDDGGKNIEFSVTNGRVSLVTRNAPVQTVLNMLAEQQGVNLITSEDVTDTVSVTLNSVAFEDALNAIVSVSGCTWTQNRGIIQVSKLGTDTRSTPELQGKIVQVFPLNFVSATDVELAAKGLMSPLGQVFTSTTMVGEKRRSQELLVVEDIPSSVARIGQYIQQVDQPPRQVMIEAHVLQIDLSDNMQHGVDWKFVTTYLGRNVSWNTAGFTNTNASPSSIFQFDGDHLDVVIQALKTTSDVKTLASPKISVSNGQEARIQIGAKLGYFVTTTTQTSTLQNVNFLNTGVQLKVTPQISNDGRVLMVVRPEISTGRISAAGLPETNTTEAETTMLMENNSGMVIGGLIKESDTDLQDKVPLLGDLWLLGRAFQRRGISRQRSEIVIVLIPRVAPYLPDHHARDVVDLQRATTPLFQNGLQQAPRPFDPRLPDAINNPRRLVPSRLPDMMMNPQKSNPNPLNYYFPTEDEELFPADAQCPPPATTPTFNSQQPNLMAPSGPPGIPAIRPPGPPELLPPPDVPRDSFLPPVPGVDAPRPGLESPPPLPAPPLPAAPLP